MAISLTMDAPFLTLPDPVTTGEGVLDPLGLSTIADRLADQILPWLRARMNRPRFVTAIAVAAAVCEGLDERLAVDGVTPAYLVFEWLVVEAFARAGDGKSTVGTPGSLKAAQAIGAGIALSAKSYLRVPKIFGFHGVYKPLARNLGIVDDDMRLGDNGYALLKIWQEEQGLPGFLESAVSQGPGRDVRQALRSAVDDGLKDGHTGRSGSWRGWSLLAEHLAPGRMAPREASCLLGLLADSSSSCRSEVFRLLNDSRASDASEATLVSEVLAPAASVDLESRLSAIVAYESVAGLLEEAFDWIRHLSSVAGAKAITVADYATRRETQTIASALPPALRKAETALAPLPLSLQQQFASLAKAFDVVKNAETLFDCVLNHHGETQKAKKPDGKREWFERSAASGVFVRVPYRLKDAPHLTDVWNRPYRIHTTQSFLRDLAVEAR